VVAPFIVVQTFLLLTCRRVAVALQVAAARSDAFFCQGCHDMKRVVHFAQHVEVAIEGMKDSQLD
jgi:hypothetical protein